MKVSSISRVADLGTHVINSNLLLLATSCISVFMNSVDKKEDSFNDPIDWKVVPGC